MVSKPNFILGIKQNISSKQKQRISSAHHHQKSHMLICWIYLHSISQPLWLNAVSKIHKLKKTHDINIRSMQIKASLDETNHTDMLHGLSWSKPRKLVSPKHLTRIHTLSLFWPSSPSATLDSSVSDLPNHQSPSINLSRTHLHVPFGVPATR